MQMLRHAYEETALLDRLSLATFSQAGALARAYQAALDGLEGVLDAIRARRVITRLVEDVRLVLFQAITDAERIGSFRADKDLRALDLIRTIGVSAVAGVAVDALMATATAQAQNAYAVIVTQPESKLGDTVRGLLTPNRIAPEVDRWIVATAGAGYREPVERAIAPEPSRYVRQAIAVIDERTTECCLRIHGQIAETDAPFQPSGDPWPSAQKYGFNANGDTGFHWYCRTRWVLVARDEVDDAMTSNMRKAALFEFERRRAEGNLKRGAEEIHPANAFSVRDTTKARMRAAGLETEAI